MRRYAAALLAIAVMFGVVFLAASDYNDDGPFPRWVVPGMILVGAAVIALVILALFSAAWVIRLGLRRLQ